MQSYKKAVSYVGISCVFLTSAAFAFLFLGGRFPSNRWRVVFCKRVLGKEKRRPLHGVMVFAQDMFLL